jgi:hypothetical protein
VVTVVDHLAALAAGQLLFCELKALGSVGLTHMHRVHQSLLHLSLFEVQ